MYAVHTTPGFVIGSRPYGEADKILSIFTRDLGMITATAPGIRLEKSKLRYSTQDYSVANFSMVRGKDFWRLTSAAAIESLPDGDENFRYSNNLAKLDGLQLTARIALLLRRFLQGEDPHPELFDCLSGLFDFLGKNEILTDDQLKTLESLTVFRILHQLGYVGESGDLQAILVTNEITTTFLTELAPKRTSINKHINLAIQESHL